MVRTARRRAFTLIELLGVIIIIALLMAFIIIAAQGAQRDAQRENTRSMIVKLEQGMNSLLDAVQTSRITPSPVHISWASGWQVVGGNTVPIPPDRGTLQRAQVLANYDEIRAQVPDVFFVQNAFPGLNQYPLDFAQQPFTGAATPLDYVLPLGTNSPLILNFNGGVTSPGTGIYGASYGAAAGLYRNLGNVQQVYLPPGNVPAQFFPQGSDGVDNDGDGQIDNFGEGVAKGGSVDPNVQASTFASLQQHKHASARSEVLYALLIEGQSQFGAFLTKDDFTAGQIGDSDNDGLPEFLDAWGNPLQFYRWPIMYHSDVQKGIWTNPAVSPCNTNDPAGPYAGVFETREQDPYDPNQLLMSPTWWSSGGSLAWPFSPVPASGPLSASAMSFQYFFHYLTEPLDLGSPSSCMFWDRSNNSAALTLHPRRAFYTRFLILSGGPDGIPGVPILTDLGLQSLGNPPAVSLALQLESAAAQYDITPMAQNPTASLTTFFGAQVPPHSNADPITLGNYFDEGLDDITNHNINSTAQVSAQ